MISLYGQLVFNPIQLYQGRPGLAGTHLCPGADDNRVRDSKQSFNLGRIFVLVTRAFIK